MRNPRIQTAVAHLNVCKFGGKISRSQTYLTVRAASQFNRFRRRRDFRTNFGKHACVICSRKIFIAYFNSIIPRRKRSARLYIVRRYFNIFAARGPACYFHPGRIENLAFGIYRFVRVFTYPYRFYILRIFRMIALVYVIMHKSRRAMPRT